MRLRSDLRRLRPMLLWVLSFGRDAVAQSSGLPPAMEDRPGISASGARPEPPAAGGRLVAPPRRAPQPMPGPAGIGLRVGEMDAELPRGLAINLATAAHLAGVQPLDIAAATAQVQQALAVLIQAKALWIPSVNGGVGYFRHDG